MKKTQMNGHERRELLSAIRKIETRFGAVKAGWGFRKHLAIQNARKKAAKRIALLRREILHLEQSAK